MLRALVFSLALPLLGFSALSAHAQDADTGRYDRLFELIGMEESFRIMSEAGQRDAIEMDADLFQGRDAGLWYDIVAGIYHPDALQLVFLGDFPGESLSDTQLQEAETFWGSDLGQRIVEGELIAWRAILDDRVEEAANEVYFEHLRDNDPRLELLDRFIEVNDFVDLNVAGALNSSFAFFRGMSDGGGYEEGLPQDLMLAEVMGQEPEIRENTTLWLYSFQLMAYAGLSDADIEAYIEFSETEAGQAYNSAIFVGFDAVFEATSYQLGQAAAGIMDSEPL